MTNASYQGPAFQWRVRVRPSGPAASRAFDTSVTGRYFDMGSVGFIKSCLTRAEAELWASTVVAWSDWSKHAVLVEVEPCETVAGGGGQ